MVIFVNDIPLLFAQMGAPLPAGEWVVYRQPDAAQVWRFYEMARDGQVEGNQGFCFEMADCDKALAAFKTNFRLLEAAGGVVRKKKACLFIYRLGKWDLPKGKLEAGESPEQASVREVEEECGVKAVLANKIGCTWHTYRDRKEREVLKCTHWFAMDCQSDEALAPQTEEDIQQVVWVPKEQVAQGPLKDTYASIEAIFEQYSQQFG